MAKTLFSISLLFINMCYLCILVSTCMCSCWCHQRRSSCSHSRYLHSHRCWSHMHLLRSLLDTHTWEYTVTYRTLSTEILGITKTHKRYFMQASHNSCVSFIYISPVGHYSVNVSVLQLCNYYSALLLC